MKRIFTLTILATLVFATAASAARWERDGTMLTEGTRTAFVSWGTLKLQTVVGGTYSYTCRNAAGGYVENLAGVGTGEIEQFAAYQCAFSACPTYATLADEVLPWTLALEGQAGAEVLAPKVDLQCWASHAAWEKAARGEGELPNATTMYVGIGEATKVVKATVQAGTSAGHPPSLAFGSESKLEQEGSHGTELDELTGRMRLLGYKESELLAVG